MPSFPNLSSGRVAKYPLTRRKKYRTTVYTHVDLSEQRFSKGVVLQEFDLTYNDVKTADKEAVREFFNERRGALDHSWDLTLIDTDAVEVTYDHLQFVPGQAFEATETKTGRWSFSLKVRQTRKNT